MKNIHYYFPVLLLLVACQSDGEQPDAFGALEATEVFISAELLGKLTAVHQEEGDEVTQDQVMALQDTMQLYLQKGQVQASMKALQAKMTDVPIQLAALEEKESVLLKEIQRIDQLVVGGAATTKQLDDLKGEYEVIRKQKLALHNQYQRGNRALMAQIEPLEWQLKMIDDQIKKAVIRSPRSGTILSCFKESAEFAGPGVPIFKMANLDELTAKVYITGNQLLSIKLGQQVTVKTDAEKGSLTSYAGRIIWIADQAEFTPKTIQTREERVNLVYGVKVAVPNPDRSLKIGMPVEVYF